jgi:hypothetical protein
MEQLEKRKGIYKKDKKILELTREKLGDEFKYFFGNFVANELNRMNEMGAKVSEKAMLEIVVARVYMVFSLSTSSEINLEDIGFLSRRGFFDNGIISIHRVTKCVCHPIEVRSFHDAETEELLITCNDVALKFPCGVNIHEVKGGIALDVIDSKSSSIILKY